MTARIIAYRSRRALAGLGETTASEAGNYAAYARAIYQAINGDVVGGAYNAALTFAGPIAAIGNAIANFLNRKGDRDSAIDGQFLDALLKMGFGRVYLPRLAPLYLTPDGKTQLMPAKGSLAVARAIANGMSPEFVADRFKEWLATGTPFNTNYSKWVSDKPTSWLTSLTSLPASVPTPVTIAPSELPPVVAITPTPAPVFTPAPQVAPPVQTFQPAPMLQTIQPAPAIASPDVVVNLPASVPPDQTPLLIQQLISQGATQQQAMTAALKSLAARGVPATPAVQTRVASDVRASALQIRTPAGMILIAALVLGFTWWVSEQS